MIRIVADTNIVVSSTLANGLPALILDLATSKKILLLVSADILAEYEEVLRRPRLKLSSSVVDCVLADIRRTSELVETSEQLAISQHESDNRFHECAEAGQADFLITGNRKHFTRDHKNTKIVTPRQFIELIDPDLPGGNR